MTDIEQLISKKAALNYEVQIQKFLHLFKMQSYHQRSAHVKLSTLEFLNNDQLKNAKHIAEQLATSPNFTIFNQDHQTLLALTPQGLLTPVNVEPNHKYDKILRPFGVKTKYLADNAVEQLQYDMQSGYNHYSTSDFADYLAQEFVNKNTNVLDISDRDIMYRNAMQETVENSITGITAIFDKTTPKVQISKA